MLKLENGVKDDADGNVNGKNIKQLQTEAVSNQVARLQFLTGQNAIPLNAVYEPDAFLKEKKVSKEKILEWDRMETERLSKLDKFGRPIK